MKRFSFTPSAPATLETRITPSPGGLASVAAESPAVRRFVDVNLYGFVLGRDTTVKSEQHLSASRGVISPLGTVSLAGDLTIPNKSGVYRAVHGTVVLSNTKGTITIRLRGTVTLSKTPYELASGNLRYKIVSATKADRGATGSGTALYGPGPVPLPGDFLLDFGHFPPPP